VGPEKNLGNIDMCPRVVAPVFQHGHFLKAATLFNGFSAFVFNVLVVQCMCCIMCCHFFSGLWPYTQIWLV